MKEKPLLDAVETCRYIVPPLHTMLGIGNGLLSDFKEFADTLLEDTPRKLQLLRIAEMKAEKDWWDKKALLAEWTVSDGPEMASAIQARKDIREILEFEAEYGTASQQNLTELKGELPVLALEIKQHQAAQKILRDAIKSTAKVWGQARKAVKAYFAVEVGGKKQKYYSKPVKSKIERVLGKHGIDYAAYHGGDLVGNDCRKLMANATKITEDLKEMLLEVAQEKGLSLETKESIVDRCTGLCYTLVCFDKVFGLMFKPNEKVDMVVDLDNLKKHLKLALAGWQGLKSKNTDGHKNIPPKVHALVQHVALQFEEYGGIGDFDEQFVERSHQAGKKDMLRSRAIRCRDKKYTSFARWEELRNHPEVLAKSEEVTKKRKRKTTGETTIAVARRKLASEAKGVAHDQTISNYVPKNLASAAQLTLREVDETSID